MKSGMSIKRASLATVMGIAVIFSGAAAAQSNDEAVSKLYVGVTAGQNDTQASVGTFNRLFNPPLGTAPAPRRAALDDSDTAFGVYVGYEFSRYFGIETQYLDLGETRYQREIQRTSFPAGLERNEITNEYQSFSLSLTARYPFTEQLRLSGRVGVAARRVETEITTSLNGTPVTVIISDDTQSSGAIVAGLGLEWVFHSRWSVRLDAQRQFDVDSRATGWAPQADNTVLSAGIAFRF